MNFFSLCLHIDFFVYQYRARIYSEMDGRGGKAETQFFPLFVIQSQKISFFTIMIMVVMT